MKHKKQETTKITFADEAASRTFGLELARQLRAGDVVALIGDLGSGKTTLTKYIAEGLGICEPVTSPTFTIIQEYEGGRLPLYHFDVYRLSGEADLEALGYEEYFYGDGVTVVEWADKISGALPPESFFVRLSQGAGESERHCAFWQGLIGGAIQDRQAE